MLLRKKIQPSCSYCVHSADAGDGVRICKKKGLVPETGSCRRFRYDPLQREPVHAKVPDFSRYDKTDFSL